MSLKTLLVILACYCLAGSAGCSLRKSKQSKTETSNQSEQPGSSQSPTRSDEPVSAHSNGGSSENVSSAPEISDELHTPVKGSEERQAIMDALRAELDNSRSSYYHPHRGDITFVVDFLKVHNGWAWMNGYPQSTSSQDSFGEFSGFLLHSENGHWSVMSLPPMVSDPADPENLDYPSRKDIAKIRQKYPTVASDIFPHS